MKIRKIAKTALRGLMSVALVAVMLTSCKKGGSSSALIENIPASACFVLKMNPQQVIENTGCSVENGKIVLSEKYTDAIRNINPGAVSMANSFLSMTEGLDLSSMMLFLTDMSRGRDVALVGAVNEPETVVKNLESITGVAGRDRDGFKTFSIEDEMMIAVGNNLIWFASDMSVINRHIEDAQEASLASVAGVAEFLSEDDALAWMVSLPKVKEEFERHGNSIEQELIEEDVPANLAGKIADVFNYNACISFKLDGSTLCGRAFLVDDNGQRNEFGKMLNEIDPGFLANVPANANSVIAMGSIADEDVKNLIKVEADHLRGRQYRADEVEVLDFLTAWDGTAAMAFDTNDVVFGWDDLKSMNEQEIMMYVMQKIKMVAMVHLPSEMISKYTNNICSMIQAANMPFNTVDTDYYSIEVPDAEITGYFGNKNGYLTFGNCDGEGATNLSDIFAGQRMLYYFTQGANPMMAEYGWDFGSEGVFRVGDDIVEFNVTLTGTTSNFLQAIFEPLTNPETIQKLQELAESMYGGYNDYDYYEYESYEEPDEYYY